MPPELALTIVLIILAFIIFIEHKTTENISGVVWIIAIWILYSGSKGLGSFLKIKTTIEAGSLPDRYFLLCLGILSIIIILNRNFPLVATLKKNVPVVLILAYSLISIVWSKTPGISLRRWGREAIALVIALLLCSESYPLKTFISAFKKAIYSALLISILLIKYYPAYGRSYDRWTGEVLWDGIASQKNGLTLICSLSILFLIWSLIQDFRNWNNLSYKFPIFIDIFMVFLALYLMMGPRRTLTYSATSFIALLVGLICLISLNKAIKYGIDIEKMLRLIAIIIIIIGIIMPFAGKIPIKSIPKLLNRNETLTERTQIWNALIPYAKRHILLGHGFGGFWTTSLRNQIASHAHNGYLDTILDLGLLGLSLFIIFMFVLIKNSFILLILESQIAFFLIPLIFMLLIRNIAEVSLGAFTSYSTWPLLACSFIVLNLNGTIKC